MHQQAVEDFAQAVRGASDAPAPLRLCGGGTKDFYGEPPAGQALDTRTYTGIVDYEPTELVVTARCGTPLAELESTLAAQNQMLAFEPPHFSPGGTLGGMVAAGLSGPRRMAAGAVRDYVLGCKVMDGSARVLSFGGRVMKNVAGYDVSRLMAGSLGSLALILEVSLKTLPRPAAEASVRIEMDEEAALRALGTWAGRLPLSASAWHEGRLCVRFSGAATSVRAACETVGGDRLEDAEAFWPSVRDQTPAFFTAPGALWRIAVPAGTSPHAFVGIRGERFIEWNGAQRWFRTDVPANVVREAAIAAGGHATLFRSGPESRSGAVVTIFQPLAPAALRIHRELKAVFDPRGVFNPGRLYPGL